MDDLNPDSLKTRDNCKIEKSVLSRTTDEPEWSDGIRRFQFERLGYFCVDKSSSPEAMVFNRTVTLKDSWVKEQAKA
jgi:glutaminyl-tRNA synthetase